MKTDASPRALGWLLAVLVFSLCLGAQVALASLGGLAIRPYLPLLLIAALLIASRIARDGYLPPVPAKGSVTALGVLLMAALLSIFNAEYATKAVTQTIYLTGMIGIYAVLLYAQLGRQDLRRIGLAILWSLAAAVLFGFIHSALEYSRSGNVLFAFAQFRSFFEERNEFGIFMVYGAGFLLPFALNDDAPARYKILFALTVCALLLNFSRGSLLALAVMVAVDRLGAGRLFSARRTRRSLVVLAATGLIAVSGIFMTLPAVVRLGDFLDVFSTRSVGFSVRSDETTSIRLLFIQTAGRAFLAHPIVGGGIGNAGNILNQYGRGADYGTVILQGAVQPPVYALGTTSNLVADLLMETGLLGFLAFAFFLVAVFRASVAQGKAEDEIGLLHTGAILSLLGVLVNGLSYNSIFLPFTWVSLALAPLTAAWLRAVPRVPNRPGAPVSSIA